MRLTKRILKRFLKICCFRWFGALRKIEMVQLTIENVIDKGSVILVQIPKTKTDESKSFTIIEEEELGALQLVRKYASLRPPGLAEKRFFLSYRSGRCTAQPVGKNTIGSVPSIIACYLKLDLGLFSRSTRQFWNVEKARETKQHNWLQVLFPQQKDLHYTYFKRKLST